MHLRAVVGIEVRLIYQCQYFTRFRIQHHQRATLGLVGFNGRLQLAMRKILEAFINRKLDGFAFAGHLEIFDFLNDAALAVLNDALLSGGTCQCALLCQLDAFLTLIVHTGEANDVRGHITGGIVAAKLALLKNTGNF